MENRRRVTAQVGITASEDADILATDITPVWDCSYLSIFIAPKIASAVSLIVKGAAVGTKAIELNAAADTAVPAAGGDGTGYRFNLPCPQLDDLGATLTYNVQCDATGEVSLVIFEEVRV